MITILNDVPENVIGFRATGEVDKDDYKSVVIPAIDKHVEQLGKINFMLVLDTAIKNFSIGAFLQDFGLGLKHFTRGIRWPSFQNVIVHKFTDFFSYIAPGEAKGFKHAELNDAKQWVSDDK